MTLDKEILALRKEAIVENLIACTEAMARLDPKLGATFKMLGRGCLAYNGPEAATTFATCLAMGEPFSEEDLDAVEAFFEERGAPYSTVDASDLADKSLHDILRRRDYQQIAVMQSWYRPLSGHFQPASNSDIEIRHVPIEAAESWAHNVAAGVGGTEHVPGPVLNMFTALGFADSCQSFLAYRKGAPAGGGVLVIRHGLAFLRTTATKMDFRGQGVQSALIAHRLKVAADAGCRTAFSSTDCKGPSARNMEKFGFMPMNQSFVFRKPLAKRQLAGNCS